MKKFLIPAAAVAGAAGVVAVIAAVVHKKNHTEYGGNQYA